MSLFSDVQWCGWLKKKRWNLKEISKGESKGLDNSQFSKIGDKEKLLRMVPLK